MYDLYLNYTEYRSGGQPLSDDSWPDYSDERIDWHPTGIFSERDNAGTFANGLNDEEIHGEFEKGDVGHLVVARYETGDTFGRTLGYWTIIGFYKDGKEAVAVKDSIDDDTYPGYKPWLGYFEHLEDIEIHTMVVQ